MFHITAANTGTSADCIKVAETAFTAASIRVLGVVSKKKTTEPAERKPL